ncbi:hypothetical protein DPMN_144099, partial [Dreissena polymorpha]
MIVELSTTDGIVFRIYENRGFMPIPFDGCPFVQLGTEVRECHYGPNRKERKKAQPNDPEHTYAGGMRKIIQNTKKHGCCCQIRMKTILRSQTIRGEVCVLVAYVGTHEHHIMGKEAGIGQRLDKEVLQKIKELAMKEGITNATEMKSHSVVCEEQVQYIDHDLQMTPIDFQVTSVVEQTLLSIRRLQCREAAVIVPSIKSGMSGIMADAMIIMDHTYIKGERVSGFQVIGSRSGPDHIYSSCAPKDSSTPPKRGSKRAVSTPTGQTPTHEHRRIELDEKTRHNKWSLDETSFLREYSQTLRKDGESENSFWNNCAIAMNNMFGGKNRTGKSCKMAAWRLNLSGTCNSTMCTSVNEDFVDFTPLSETKGNNVGTQTDLSNKQDWFFFEPRKNLQG